MKTIRCQNKFIGRKNDQCGRILGVFSDLQFDLLHLDEEGIILRCPECPPEQRWIKVWKKKTGELVFEVLEHGPDCSNVVEFNELIICQQVG